MVFLEVLEVVLVLVRSVPDHDFETPQEEKGDEVQFPPRVGSFRVATHFRVSFDLVFPLSKSDDGPIKRGGRGQKE